MDDRPIRENRISHTDTNQIDLTDLIRVLWAGKWLIFGIAASAIAVSIAVALMMPNIYRAEAVFVPNKDEGISNLAAQYGGLASLAGINLGDETSDKTALGLKVLQSRKFLSEFVQRHDILVPLFAAEGWDQETGDLEIDRDIYDVAAKKWVRKVRPPRKSVPSMLEAHEKLTGILDVSEDKRSGFVTVAVEYYSPTIAKEWVDLIISDLNRTIMEQDVAEAEQSIEYLTKQIENTSLAELQNVFFRLIEEQTKTMMLANVSKEYLLKTVDPAVAPEKKDRPKRSLIVLFAALLGGLLGMIIQVLRSSL